MTNVLKLALTRMSFIAVPKGGGFYDAITFLSDKRNIKAGIDESKARVETAIKTVRQAGEPNPFKTATDEEIAGELLKRFDMVRACYRNPGKGKYGA